MTIRTSRLLIAMLATGAPVTSSAQSPAIRTALDSVFVLVGSADSVPRLAAAQARCASMNGRGKSLCDAFVKLRIAELNSTPDDAVRAEQAFRAVHFYEDKWPYMWYGLGLTRIVMGRTQTIAKEAPLQPPGVTNEAGASHAFVRALELEPNFTLVAEALALAPIPREGASQMTKRVGMLRSLRARGVAFSPMAWAMMGLVEREAGSPDSAAAVLTRALQVGADSGFSGYELARALYLAGRANEGRAAFVAAALHATSPLGARRFDRIVRMVGSPADVAAWDSLAVPARGPWLAGFWDRRDVRDGRGPGELLAEHFRRIEDAWKRFRIDIPRTGRHRDAMGSSAGGAGGLDFEAGTDIYLDTYANNSPFRTYMLPDEQLDDRGAIFIRHGNPTAIGRTVSGDDLELWRYDQSDGPRFFAFREVRFDGSSGAGVLTPQLASAPNRVQLCAVDQRLCIVRPGREAIQANQMREEGLAAIKVGTTTDAHPRAFTGRLDPIVQIYGLDRASGGSPRLVAAFAIPATQLRHTSPPEAGGRTVYSVRLQLMTIMSNGMRRDADTTRHFASARRLVDGEFLTGLVEFPVPAGQHSASLVVTQADGRGAVASLGAVSVPGTGALTVSDLVLGREGSGVRWNSGATLVPLNPLNAYTQGEAAELYFQLGGMTPGVSYETRLEFLLAGQENLGAKLTLAFNEDAREPRREIQRTVALTELSPGRYRLRVTVAGNGQRAVATALLVVAMQ